MRQLLHIPLRLVAGLVSLLLLYMAFFLYKDEREGIQNYLDEAWKKLRKKQRSAISRHVAFMQTVADLTSELFDRIFGERYFSLRAFTVSICLSTLSLLVSFLIQKLYESGVPVDGAEMLAAVILVAIVVIVIVIFVICLVLSIRFPTLSKRKAWFFIVFSAALIVTVDILWDEEADLTVWYLATLIAGSAGVLFVSFACDIGFMAVTRQGLRWASALKSVPKIVGIVTLNLLIAAILLVYPFWWSNQQLDYERGANVLGSLTGAYNPVARVGKTVHLLSSSNLVDALGASAFIIFGLLMLLHRVFWPLFARPVYALADLGVIGHRKLLGTVGLALLGYATGKPMEILTKLVELFYKK
jgi:hypothetical protein